MVSNDTLGESLSNGIDLGGVTRTSNSDSNVKVGESVLTEQEDGFVDLGLEDLGVDQVDGGTVDLEETLTRSDGSNSDGVFLSTEGLD